LAALSQAALRLSWIGPNWLHCSAAVRVELAPTADFLRSFLFCSAFRLGVLFREQ
jgi:hypothetical protein